MVCLLGSASGISTSKRLDAIFAKTDLQLLPIALWAPLNPKCIDFRSQPNGAHLNEPNKSGKTDIQREPCVRFAAESFTRRTLPENAAAEKNLVRYEPNNKDTNEDEGSRVLGYMEAC